jgi:uncharacterized protein YcbK (DUF882 family)
LRSKAPDSVRRRAALRAGLAAAAALLCAPRLARAALSPAEPTLSFYNLHTGESLVATYRAGDRYVPEELAAIDRLLRDFRTGDVHPIDVRLLELLARVHARLGSARPFAVISGYRSPRTNAMLAAESGGVASHSLHMRGQAIDVRLADRPLDQLREAGLALRGGGVGFYPRSDFVHLDVGPVRRW